MSAEINIVSAKFGDKISLDVSNTFKTSDSPNSFKISTRSSGVPVSPKVLPIATPVVEVMT